jgi:hypothetical protein
MLALGAPHSHHTIPELPPPTSTNRPSCTTQSVSSPCHAQLCHTHALQFASMDKLLRVNEDHLPSVLAALPLPDARKKAVMLQLGKWRRDPLKAITYMSSVAEDNLAASARPARAVRRATMVIASLSVFRSSDVLLTFLQPLQLHGQYAAPGKHVVCHVSTGTYLPVSNVPPHPLSPSLPHTVSDLQRIHIRVRASSRGASSVRYRRRQCARGRWIWRV